MHSIIRTGALGLAVSLFASAVSAATFHVAPTGSDSNSGTSASPWRTLQKAANTVRAGDVVLVADGTYSGFQIRSDGTVSAPIVFRAQGSAAVVNAPNSSTPDNINIEGGNYVVVEGFVVDDAPRCGIRVVTATGVVIRGNTIAKSGLDGILTGFTPGIQILDNVVSDSNGQHAIYVSNSSTANDNVVVRGNVCSGSNENGIQLNGDCHAGGDGVISGALLEDNVVHHNNWKGFSLISVQNSTIRNNLVYENGLLAGAGGIHLADQPDCGKPSNGNVIANNTIHEPRITGIRISNGSTNNTIFNNLVIAQSLAYTIADNSGGNNIDPQSNIKLTSASGVFAGVTTGNYHLAATSPAVDGGMLSYDGVSAPPTDLEGVDRPQAGQYDVGAYEQASATSVSGRTPAAISLEQNFPNPFNASTRIAFTVPSGGTAPVTLDIFDVRGRRVRRLFHNQAASGRVEVSWDGINDHGERAPSGMYYSRLTAPGSVSTSRMLLIR